MKLKWYGLILLVAANLVLVFFNYSESVRYIVSIYSITFMVIGIILISIDCRKDDKSYLKKLRT